MEDSHEFHWNYIASIIRRANTWPKENNTNLESKKWLIGKKNDNRGYRESLSCEKYFLQINKLTRNSIKKMKEETKTLHKDEVKRQRRKSLIFNRM